MKDVNQFHDSSISVSQFSDHDQTATIFLLHRKFPFPLCSEKTPMKHHLWGGTRARSMVANSYIRAIEINSCETGDSEFEKKRTTHVLSTLPRIEESLWSDNSSCSRQQLMCSHQLSPLLPSLALAFKSWTHQITIRHLSRRRRQRTPRGVWPRPRRPWFPLSMNIHRHSISHLNRHRQRRISFVSLYKQYVRYLHHSR